MVIAIDPDRRWDYVPDDDRAFKKQTAEEIEAGAEPEPVVAEEDRTVFHLQALTPAQLAEVTDGGMTQDKLTGAVSYRAAMQVLKILTYGLRGWTNFKDIDGVLVPVPEASMDKIARMSEALRVEGGLFAFLQCCHGWVDRV